MAKRRRGQPLAVLLAVLALWAGFRGTMWESPFPLMPTLEKLDELLADASPIGSTVPPSRTSTSPAETGDPRFDLARVTFRGATPTSSVVHSRLSALIATRGEPVDLMAAHQLMWLAAMERQVMLSGKRGVTPLWTLPGSSLSTAEPASSPDRWTLDGWLFLRQRSNGIVAPGARPATYGASQAGAVLRYRLAPRSDHRPAAYLRTVAALAGPSDREAAFGLSARPIPGLPVAVQGEVRLRSAEGGDEIRPAALAVSELPPLILPGGFEAEAYTQAGYVGGDFATAFADGQARVTRQLARFDLGSVRAGAGAWAGVQKGAARVDLGPSATIDVRLGKTPARLAVDYRLRVAGDAEPGSGVAVTLSTGF